MFRNKYFALIALIAVFALLCTACGSKSEATEPAGEVLNLSDWTLTATTWSSPNGATVNLSATPAGYVEGQTAAFIVRLEGEDVWNTACAWDGTHYTASADLNGADGYCYYVLLTGTDGMVAEVAVNVPDDPFDESLINMAASLESFCSLIPESFAYDGKWLTITAGTLTVQPPRIVNQGESITCTEAALVLSLNGEESTRISLDMSAATYENGSYILDLTDVSFETPALEDDYQLSVRLEAALSNGQFLAAEGGSWFYNNGNLMMGVG